MSILRVFPRANSMTPRDDLAVLGYRMRRYSNRMVWEALPVPMERTVVDEVHVSVTFTWDIDRGKALAASWEQYHPVVKIGGPAFGTEYQGFVPGRYIRPGVTFTSRGCNNNCPWCLVPEREGRLVELAEFPEGNYVQDNNLAQCSAAHIDRVFAMLAHQKDVQFTGGIDARLVTTDFADRVRGLRLGQIFLACDTAGSLKHLQQAVSRLALPAHGKVRCYVLIGKDNETISDATGRLEDVWATGAMPHAQLYQPSDNWIDYPKDWRDLNRQWSRPALMRGDHNRRVLVV